MSDHLLVESPDLMVGFEPAGSACCVWRDALATYVLSAAHVLAGLPMATPIRWISADLTSSGRGRALSDKLWLSMLGGELDGGLVEVDDPGPFGIGGAYPRGVRILPWHAIGDGLVVQICGKKGLETATFDDKRPAGAFFKGHRHGRLLQFRFLQHTTTDPGDSGAAIVSLPEVMLVGMHVARRVDDQGVAHSLAVAAEDVRDTFGALLPGFDLRP